MPRVFKAALVIGLGGTGVLALQHIKAQLVGGEQHALPANVKLLAFDTVQEQDQAEDTGSTLKGVALDPGEYFWIGGDVYDFSQEVRQGKQPHVGSWYQAETYLKTLPRASFTLQRGAGMLRQFGRLAIFKDVAAPAMSNIRKLINNAITEIRNTGFIANLDVFLVSSVAGGTGAGMFVDIAYLVRMLAQEEQNGQKITLRGFLVLPEAFSAIPGGVVDSMRARAYAAMRENRRFMVDFSWKNGYPMYYQPTGQGGVWRSRLSTKLFDALYHIDGQRPNNPLTQVLPKFGVTASIGDAVVAMLDDPDNKYGQHNANVITASGREEGAAGRTSFDSAIGTFTMLLPMRQIVESMGYRLLLQELESLCAPASHDEDGYIVGLAPDRNLEVGDGVRGRDAAAEFLQASEVQALVGGEKIQMTLLPPEMYKIAVRYDPTNPGLIDELVARAPSDWESALDPTGETADVVQMRSQVRQELESSLLAEVPPKLQGEKAQDAVVRIPPAVDRFKAEHFGREDPRSGQRSGGKYRQALDMYATKHLDRFRDALRVQMLNSLNGSAQRGARESRTGKIGYLRDMLDGLDVLLGRFILAMDGAYKRREELGARSSLVGSVQVARQEMERKPSGVFGWGGAQKSYLEAEDRLIASIKTDILESSVRGIAEQMQKHVRMLKGSADEWATTLAIGYDSLYGRALRGQKKQEDILQEQNEVKVRRILPEIPKPADRRGNKDEQAKEAEKEIEHQRYHDEVYHRYAEDLQDGLASVLSDLQWGYERRRSGGSEVHGLTLSLKGAAAVLEARGQERNLELFLNHCRHVFDDAWEQESVLKYLMRRFPRPEALAKELVENGGPLLSFSGGKPTPANYFHITSGNDKLEREYLDGVKKALVQLSGATGVLNEVINSNDRFACRLIYTLDLVPLDQVSSYKTARPAYLGFAYKVDTAESRGQLGRETLHLFPAEVNAAKFEGRISRELGLTAREFDNEVVLQLEDMPRFRMFVRAWVYGVICRQRQDVASGYEHYFALKLPTEHTTTELFGGRRSQEIFLSEPSQNAPSLLAALEAYQYIGKDIRIDIEEPIPYDRMERAVDMAKSDAVKVKLDIQLVGEPPLEMIKQPLANVEPMVKQYLDRLPQPDQVRAWKLLAERSILQERQAEVRQQLGDGGLPMAIRDTATVFWLTLEDEIKSVQEAIKSLLEASRGIS